MKLSETTLQILKNFSTICPSLLVRPGNVLRTWSANKAIMAEATLDVSFPILFGIYDLPKLIAVLSIHEQPEIKFDEHELVLSSKEGKVETHLRYTEPDLVPNPPAKGINCEDFEVSFELTEDQLKWINKIGSVLKCPHVLIHSKDGNIVVTAADAKKKVVDNSSSVVAQLTEKVSFSFALNVENMKILPGNYKVDLNAAGFARFSNKDSNVTYWLSMEKAHTEFTRG